VKKEAKENDVKKTKIASGQKGISGKVSAPAVEIAKELIKESAKTSSASKTKKKRAVSTTGKKTTETKNSDMIRVSPYDLNTCKVFEPMILSTKARLPQHKNILQTPLRPRTAHTPMTKESRGRKISDLGLSDEFKSSEVKDQQKTPAHHPRSKH
jgi:hypothetical protein